MGNRNMYLGLMSGMYEVGIILEKVVEFGSTAIIYISVPETSDIKDNKGADVAGMVLAKRISEFLKHAGVRAKLMARVRKGDHWTKERGEEARDFILKMVR